MVLEDESYERRMDELVPARKGNHQGLIAVSEQGFSMTMEKWSQFENDISRR